MPYVTPRCVICQSRFSFSNVSCQPPSERVGYERLMAEARTHLDDPAFAAAWAEGEALTLEQAVALALTVEQPS